MLFRPSLSHICRKNSNAHNRKFTYIRSHKYLLYHTYDVSIIKINYGQKTLYKIPKNVKIHKIIALSKRWFLQQANINSFQSGNYPRWIVLVRINC